MVLGPVSTSAMLRRSQPFGPANPTAGGYAEQPAMYGASNLTAYWLPYKGWPLYKHYHNGTDWTVGLGASLLAMETGKVIHAGIRYVSDSTGKQVPNGGGLVIGVEIRPGTSYWYSHCSELLASVGSIVTKGQIIARMGRTGVATGVHAHVGVEIAEIGADGRKRTILHNPEMFQAGGPYANDTRIRPVYGQAPPTMVAWNAYMRCIASSVNIRSAPGGTIVGVASTGMVFLSYRINKSGTWYVDPRNGNRRRDWVEVRYQNKKRWIAKAFLVTIKKL